MSAPWRPRKRVSLNPSQTSEKRDKIKITYAKRLLENNNDVFLPRLPRPAFALLPAEDINTIVPNNIRNF